MRGDTAQFDDDIKGGGMLLELPSGLLIATKCKVKRSNGEEVEVNIDPSNEPFYDPKTGKEVFYPGWAEW